MRRVGDPAIVRVQGPIRLDDRAEPEPDLALLRPRPDYYASGHPRPQDVLLIVGVAETSLACDRPVKLLRYAQAGIPEVWLLILADPSDPRRGQATVWTSIASHRPTASAMRCYVREERLALQALPDLSFLMAEVLGA